MAVPLLFFPLWLSWRVSCLPSTLVHCELVFFLSLIEVCWDLCITKQGLFHHPSMEWTLSFIPMWHCLNGIPRSVVFIIALILLLKYFLQESLRDRTITGIVMWMSNAVWTWITLSSALRIVIIPYSVFISLIEVFLSSSHLRLFPSGMVLNMLSF